MADKLVVEPRGAIGTRHNRRLRATGKLPAVLYGHGQDVVNLAIDREQVRGVLRHGGKVVVLEGAADGQALVQDTQWDAFGSRLLHIDLMRVDASELLHVEVEVDLKGDSVGTREGGILQQLLRTVEIEAPPASIPERLFLDVTELHLGESMYAGAISGLPEGAKLVTDPEATVVNCVKPMDQPEEDPAAEAAAGEPELIGGDKGGEDSGDDS